ncbi:hypothetical protein GQ457_07G009670 [Hibiscus cannabinus]
MIMLKLLGRRIGLHALLNRVYAVWKPCMSFNLMCIEIDYSLVKFQYTKDYERVLSEGPYVIYDQYLTIQP